jgi:hypothetical protein
MEQKHWFIEFCEALDDYATANRTVDGIKINLDEISLRKLKPSLDKLRLITKTNNISISDLIKFREKMQEDLKQELIDNGIQTDKDFDLLNHICIKLSTPEMSQLLNSIIAADKTPYIYDLDTMTKRTLPTLGILQTPEE